MHKRKALKIILTAALTFASGAGLAQTKKSSKTKPKPAPKKLVFGLITPRNAEQTQKSWAPFLERMSHALGVATEAKTYAQQGDLVNDFKSGGIDFAWMGNVPAIELVEAQVGAVFGQLVVKGQFAYRSLLITHRDSEIRSLNDIVGNKGKYVFGDGDLKSTSGHIVPRYFAFAKKGVNDVDALFKEIKRLNGMAVMR